MKKKQIAGRLFKGLGREGALKRHMPLAVMFIAILAAVMANYALSANTIYDAVSSGDYVDVGLDKTRGISMDLVEKGLTHKVLEFEITSEISSQDIQLLIAENNFDAKEGSLAKAEIVQREYPLYENVCSPYSLPEEANGSIVRVENCTTVQKGTRTVESEEWLPVDMKSAEENADSSLAIFNILGKGRYRYSFDTPIVETANGWGNKGTVFLKTGDGLFADKQHSSDWYDNANIRKLLEITNALGTLNLTLQDLVLNLSGFGVNNITFINADDGVTTYKWVNLTPINATTKVWLSLPNISNGITRIYVYNVDSLQNTYYIDDLEAKIWSQGGEYQSQGTALGNWETIYSGGTRIYTKLYSSNGHGNTSDSFCGSNTDGRARVAWTSQTDISFCYSVYLNSSITGAEVWYGMGAVPLYSRLGLIPRQLAAVV